jgi:hypothetical protein
MQSMLPMMIMNGGDMSEILPLMMQMQQVHTRVHARKNT